MSPYFIAYFKKQNKCPGCSADKKSGYSVCQKHLVKAREHFRQWSKNRRSQGLCCYCHRKSYKGFLRCKFHTEKNREVIRKWIAEHPEHNRQQWEKKKQLIAVGLCGYCKEHRRRSDRSISKCDLCLDRHRIHDMNYRKRKQHIQCER